MARSRYSALVDTYLATSSALTQPSLALAGVDPSDWLVSTQEIEHALAEDLRSGDSDVREAAAVNLQGYAALDLAVAVDLARQVDGGSVGLAADAPSQFAVTLAQIQPLLASESALGVRVPYATAALGEGSSLRDAAHQAIDSISGDAARIAASAVGGLIDIPRSALFASFGQAADKWLNAIYEQVGRGVGIVIKALVKAASKFLRLLGPLEAPVRRWLSRRLGEITLERVVDVASDALLGVADLRLAVDSLLDDAAGDAVAGDAGARLQALSGRFETHRKLSTTALGLLAKIQGWIIALATWAPAAVAAVYVLVMAYGIVAGGDFLDWTRIPDTSALDLVDGVRTIVAGATRP